MSGTVVLDLDGVLYVDDVTVPGAADALAELERAGFAVVFVTNNSTRTPEQAAAKIARRLGRPVDPAAVVTSAEATALTLAGTVTDCLVLGEPGLVDTLRLHGLRSVDEPRRAEAVVVGLDRGLTYDRLADAALAVRAGARFVATGDDATYPTPRGLLPGAGAIVAAVATASGRDPEVCGKPHLPMRALVRSRIGPPPVWVVGDRPETDLALARAEGWGAVLVLTGVVDDPGKVPADVSPDLVLPSVAELPAALDQITG